MVIVPHHHTKFSEPAFAVAGPSVWNALLQNVCDSSKKSVFHARLEMYSFKNAYSW